MAEFITEVRKGKTFLLSIKVEPDETTLTIPDEVEILEKDCFKGLTNIKRLSLSSKIKNFYYFEKDERGVSVSQKAHFRDLESLEYIDINNVTSLNSGDFYECRKLVTIKSNNKLKLDRNSLLHCFSLKEINCDEEDIDAALGDTNIFNYPLLNKELDVAKIKIDYDFKKPHNQKEYIDSWPANLESRIKREYILLDNDWPVVVLEDTDFSKDAVGEFFYVLDHVSDKLCDIGPFERVEGILPWPNCSLMDYETFIDNIEKELHITLQDYHSPRTRLNSLEDALYFFKLMYISDEFESLCDDIDSGEVDVSRCKELLDEYLLIHKNYCLSINQKQKADVIEALRVKISSDDKEVLKIANTAYEIGSLADVLISINPVFDNLEWQINKQSCVYIMNVIANSDGRNVGNLEKYYMTGPTNRYEVYDYYSISFNGDLNKVLYYKKENPLDSYLDDLFVYYAHDSYKNLFCEHAVLTLYANYFLRDDKESLKALRDKWNNEGNTAIIIPEEYDYLLKEESVREIKSSYIWYSCGLKPTNIDYLKFLLDEKYFDEIMPNGKWSTFLIAFDIENIILSHDFDSFKVIYEMTKNMKKEDYYQQNNFYFSETAFANEKTINILSEEGFATISEVNDQPID